MTQQIMEQLPYGVDPRQVLTTEQFRHFSPDINLEKALRENRNLPPLPATTDICEIRTYLDGRLGRIWKEGEVIFQLYLPSDYPLETTIWEVNGEIATIQTVNQMLLDRTQDLDREIIEKKNNSARERLRK
ncbi:MAG: hypothetical protein QNJ37_08755 [Crocosphaera sp.]|nr:hypothetical protein [Crocosphaera sp.]MDJ0731811.1 hypothetical protein [Crocosphaera sp.]